MRCPVENAPAGGDSMKINFSSPPPSATMKISVTSFAKSSLLASRYHEPDKISPNFSPLFLLFSSLFFKENSRENINIFLYIFFSIIFFMSPKLKKIIFHMIFFPFLSIFRKPNIALCYDWRKIGLPIYHGFKVISQ